MTKNKQGGFIGIAIAIIVALAILGGGYIAVKNSHKSSADVTVQGSASGNSSVQAGGVTGTSDGTSAAVNVGGVTITTNGTAASVTYKGTNSSGAVTTAPGTASVTTKTNTSVSGSGSAQTGTASAGASAVSISSISPSSASIGQTITINGNGFSKSGNTIKVIYGFTGTMSGFSSTDGSHITLTIPQTIQTGPVAVQVQPGTYVVSVINASGAESNKVTFTINR